VSTVERKEEKTGREGWVDMFLLRSTSRCCCSVVVWHPFVCVCVVVWCMGKVGYIYIYLMIYSIYFILYIFFVVGGGTVDTSL